MLETVGCRPGLRQTNKPAGRAQIFNLKSCQSRAVAHLISTSGLFVSVSGSSLNFKSIVVSDRIYDKHIVCKSILRLSASQGICLHKNFTTHMQQAQPQVQISDYTHPHNCRTQLIHLAQEIGSPSSSVFIAKFSKTSFYKLVLIHG